MRVQRPVELLDDGVFYRTVLGVNQRMPRSFSNRCVCLLMNSVPLSVCSFSGFPSLKIRRKPSVMSPVFRHGYGPGILDEDVDDTQNVVRVVVMTFKPLHVDEVGLPLVWWVT